MIHILFIFISLFMHQSVFAHSEHADCFLDIIPKIYVNPERIFSESENYYLSIDEETVLSLPNLQQDAKGYFVEFSLPSSVGNIKELMLRHIRDVTSPCPLCGTPGYIAGMCSNSSCPGKENRRRAEEERKRKKDDYSRKKKEEAEKKKKK